MDLGLAPQPLGFGATPAWGCARRLGIDGAMLPVRDKAGLINVKKHVRTSRSSRDRKSSGSARLSLSALPPPPDPSTTRRRKSHLITEVNDLLGGAVHTSGGPIMSDFTLWGFDGSTYVRTIKMLFAEKGFTQFDQVPLNVLEGEPRTPEHLERHPFGKVPVLDHDGMRILETTAIARYLNDVLPGRSLIPATPKDRARMDMIIGVINSTATAR